MPVTLGASTPCKPRLNVYIADNSPAMREGLARLISDECDMAVTNSAATAAELRQVVSGAPPEVLVTDMVLDDVDGLALIQDLLGIAPRMRIVVFTGLPAEVYGARCLQAGARAFVSKRDSVSQLFRAIRDAANGSIVLPAGIPDRTAAELTGRKQAASAGMAAELTNRELQVFRLVGQAMATKEVAAKLGVSVKTVETHRENIKNKLGLDSHAELVACAAQWLRESDGV